jgi:predicted nuclease of restriction endonuclease-like RecB superfamily
MSPSELALRANLRMVNRYLERAHSVTIRAYGNTRALVRHVKLRRLLCLVQGDAAVDEAELRVSGPFALFRQTAIYGRALASLVPRLAWCRRFTLQAVCSIERMQGPRTLVLRSGDPIFPAEEGRRFDSRLEERFARDFARAAPDWEIVREPRPVSVGSVLIFPDFALRRREGDRPSWLLEIVGFWTREYLERKLALLRQARLEHFVLCIDEEREPPPGDLPPGARVVRFRRRIDPAAVLALIEGS